MRASATASGSIAIKYQSVRRLPQSKSARRNRQDLNDRSTPAERKLKAALKRANVRFIQNFRVDTAESFNGYYMADFYLPQHKLFVEVDGGIHKSETNKWKDRLRQEAIVRARPNDHMVRFWNSEVERDPDALVKFLKTF